MKETNNEGIIIKLIDEGYFLLDKNNKIWRTSGKGVRKKLLANGKYETKFITAEKKIPNGYLQVRAKIGEKRYHCYAHRIIWIYFNGNIPKGKMINHKNGIKTDNCLDNLEVVTCSQNRLHASRVLGIGCGERNSMAKFTEQDVFRMKELRQQGMKV